MRAPVQIIVLVLALIAGCFNGENGHGIRTSPWRESTAPASASGELGDFQTEALIEERLLGQLPPPPDEATQTLHEVRLHRRRLADEMATQAQGALAPLAITAALFAVDGPVDLLLSVVPVGKLGKAYHQGKKALQARKARKLTDRAARAFVGELDGASQRLLRLAQHLSRVEVQALKRVHLHTGSQAVVTTLLDKHVRQSADVRWIAAKLDAGKVSPVFARRFTFDADLVEDITDYRAGISWKTLQDVIEGKRVASGARGALASKIMGLLGERAAAGLVREPAFARKYLDRVDDSFVVSRGLSYTGGSLDLVATNLKDKVLYGEVKNWGASTWQSVGNRQKVLDQLRRHNQGISAHLTQTGRSSHEVAGRVLFVAEDGFLKGWGDRDTRDRFLRAIRELGWTIEHIPSKRIGTFTEFIDDLR